MKKYWLFYFEWHNSADFESNFMGDFDSIEECKPLICDHSKSVFTTGCNYEVIDINQKKVVYTEEHSVTGRI